MSDDRGVVSRGTGQRSTVTRLLLDVADDGTFWQLGDGEDVSDGEGGLLSAVDERAGGDAFGSDEGFRSELVAVRVTENDTGEGSTTVEKKPIPFMISSMLPGKTCPRRPHSPPLRYLS